MHIQNIRPSPDLESIDRPLCGQPVLTTQRILDVVNQVTSQSRWALDRLSDSEQASDGETNNVARPPSR